MNLYRIYATSPCGMVKMVSEVHNLKIHEAHILHFLKLRENKIEIIFYDDELPKQIDKLEAKIITTISI